MGDLSPTSPLVPGLGGFGAMTTVPVGAIDEDHPIDPTSPTTLKHSNSNSSSGHSSSSSSGSRTSRRKSRGHKERPDSTYAGLSSRDLARMLVEEEIRTSHFSKWSQTLSSQLSQQKQRADDAERRATNAAVRLKEETEARIRLEQALKRKSEELKLYQVQLKKAQGEIFKAQDALAEVEKMRDEAEHAATKARNTARKLREQRLVDIAREEGRRVGLKEGLARGQEVDYVDRGYGYLEGGAAVEEIEDDDYYSRTTRSRHSPPPRAIATTAPPTAHGGGGGGRAPGITDPPEERVLNPMTVTTPVLIPSPEPSPPKLSQPVPIPTPEPAIPPRPVSVASVGTRPTPKQAPIPPDVWIPVSNGDGIRLPPPHELSPQVTYPMTLPPQPQPPSSVSPTPPPVKSPSNRPILVVPPSASDARGSDKDSVTTGTSYSPITDRHESHHRRRRSSDSQASTTMSQMDILGPPASGRDQRTLSSITEERASAISSAIASPNNTPSVRSLQSNPNLYQTNAAASHIPSPRVPSINVDPAQSLHKSSSMSSDEYKFDVIPPSRPTSKTFSDSSNIPGVTTSQHGMLSAEDAHHRPLPDINTPPVQSPPAVVVSEPPPGFVPFNASPAQTNRSPLPANPEPLSPSAGWGFNFQNLPSTHVEEPPTAPVIPASLSSKSKQALSNVSGVSGSSKYSTPSQIPTHITGTGSRNRRPPSTTSSDDEVSSDLSSDNSLTTPPAQPRRLLTPIYGPVGLPLAVPGTGRTAPVSLPTQTPGTGRTNPANLPPMQQSQQSQNPDVMPSPGAMGEPPAPTTTTSTRGRGTGNRGKKRR